MGHYFFWPLHLDCKFKQEKRPPPSVGRQPERRGYCMVSKLSTTASTLSRSSVVRSVSTLPA